VNLYSAYCLRKSWTRLSWGTHYQHMERVQRAM